jgi:hypothetical protein
VFREDFVLPCAVYASGQLLLLQIHLNARLTKTGLSLNRKMGFRIAPAETTAKVFVTLSVGVILLSFRRIST